MHKELNNFIRNQVWELVERPKEHNVIGTKWVFRNKQDQVASTSSQPNDQVSASNVSILQPTNIARDHPLDTIIRDISRGV